ncbi:hypothetical protein [Methylobacterium marchantiae]|uniref:Uncharacterized protein n=1 Tax=Methylobacterium marchantiae TaxID=600331 RepID=A0ABW3X3I5_9HYPH|nr:hypothetical protein AIGOOFII_3474 [Methylobacterium marchantiae]
MARVPFTLRLPPELKADLERMAEKDRRNLTQYVELVLEAHVKEKLPTTVRQTQRQAQ